MSDIFRTLIVTAADAPLAREIAATLSSGGAAMWTTPLSPTGNMPITHYVSSGFIPVGWQAMVPTQIWSLNTDGNWEKIDETFGDPITIYNRAIEVGLTVTQEEINTLFANADITEQEPFVAFSRLNLQMCTEDIHEQ